MPENLSPEERAAVVKLLRDTIAADRFPLSPRVCTLKSALARLDDSASPAAQQVPPPKAWGNSSIRTRTQQNSGCRLPARYGLTKFGISIENERQITVTRRLAAEGKPALDEACEPYPGTDCSELAPRRSGAVERPQRRP